MYIFHGCCGNCYISGICTCNCVICADIGGVVMILDLVFELLDVEKIVIVMLVFVALVWVE